MTAAGPVMTEDKQLMGIKEAAEALGLSPGTVRRWLKKGMLQGYRSNTGEWQVEITDEARALADQAAKPLIDPDTVQLVGLSHQAQEDALARLRADNAMLAEEVRTLQAQLATQAAVGEVQRQEIDRLHALIRVALAKPALPPPPPPVLDGVRRALARWIMPKTPAGG